MNKNLDPRLKNWTRPRFLVIFLSIETHNKPKIVRLTLKLMIYSWKKKQRRSAYTKEARRESVFSSMNSKPFLCWGKVPFQRSIWPTCRQQNNCLPWNRCARILYSNTTAYNQFNLKRWLCCRWTIPSSYSSTSLFNGSTEFTLPWTLYQEANFSTIWDNRAGLMKLRYAFI